MKLLIVKTSALGDIIHTFPALSCLRKKLPAASIHWVVEKPFSELVQAHPFVDRVLTINTKGWRRKLFDSAHRQEIRAFHTELKTTRYDAVFDFQGNMKSSLVTFFARSPIKVGFGWSTVHEWPNCFFTNRRFNPQQGLNIRDDYLHLVQSYFGDHFFEEDQGIALKINSQQQALLGQILDHHRLQKGPKILVCPGSAWVNKQLTREAFAEFLRHMQEHFGCCFLFIWGTAEEKQMAQEFHSRFSECSIVVDKLPLPLLQNLMGNMDLIIAMDSLPLHLAGTTATPTFSVFGASSSSKFKPKGTQHLSFQGECPYGRTFKKRCPVLRTCPTGACIRSLTGKQVFDQFLSNSALYNFK